MTTMRIYNKDRDWIMELKNKLKLRSAEATFEKIIQLIKKYKIQEEI